MRKSCNSIAQLKCTSWGDGHICTIQCSGHSHPWLSAFEIWPSRMRKSIFILPHCIWLHLYLNHHIQLAHTVCCPSCRQKPASNTLVWNLVENDSYSETWQDLCCLIFIKLTLFLYNISQGTYEPNLFSPLTLGHLHIWLSYITSSFFEKIYFFWNTFF